MTALDGAGLANEVVFIDLSSVAYPIWHTSQGETDMNATSTRTVAKIRALASGRDRVAVCCDSGRSFRYEVDPEYKANRPERDAALIHQIDRVKEILIDDGFPVWSVVGFEADDLIATAVRLATEDPRGAALVVSSDKDLLQLVGPSVRAKSAVNGTVLDEAGVLEKFGVTPAQMCDYLTLVGDASDNIRGAKGIGPKKACEILRRFGSLDALYAKLADQKPDHGLKPAELASLVEFLPRLETVRSLIQLCGKVEIPYEQLGVERVPVDAFESAMREIEGDEMPDAEAVTVQEELPIEDAEIIPAEKPKDPTAEPGSALAVREVEVFPSPSDYERQLDPRSMREARVLAEDMFRSRMFSSYGTPHGVLSTVMVGRELGIPAMASLRSIHVVEGRHTLGAALMVALVLKSGLAEYFEPVSFDAKQATFETKRKGARKAVTLTHTIEMAIAAGLVKPKSNWEKVPVDMLCARAQARLARLVYPDLLAGLYTPEELSENS